MQTASHQYCAMLGEPETQFSRCRAMRRTRRRTTEFPLSLIPLLAVILAGARLPPAGAVEPILKPERFKHYIDAFNEGDNELYKQQFPNVAAWDFLKHNIPLLDCADKGIEEIYYFRWWTYRKHIRATPDGFVITEFLPNVGWSGKYNTISCAAGHHLYEGRWLHDPKFLDDYSVFWFRKGGKPRSYSFWAADAIWKRAMVTGDTALAIDLLPDLVENFRGWEKDRLTDSGLLWQIDDSDGMEVAIGGTGCRPTINSYMYGDALAIAAIATLAGKPQIAEEFRAKAARLKDLVQTRLWDPKAEFFKLLRRAKDGTISSTLTDVRELHGYTPWYFDLPDNDKSVAWAQILDPQGFYAPFGPTTAERRHPGFALNYDGHECQWNGPSWPYSTSITLVAMANLLNDYKQNIITRRDYLDLLSIYAKSHHLKREDGTVVPWIDENINPLTGDWLARTRLAMVRKTTPNKDRRIEERGKDYNHSTFCDLVISGLVGLRPRADDTVEVNPLVPTSWDFFCLDQVRYHGRSLTVLWDRTGRRYNRGAGLRVLADGKQIAAADGLRRVTGLLSPRTWQVNPPG
jgi:hypothetical protein